MSNNPRYAVRGFKEIERQCSEVVIEMANTAEEANILYDIMLEDDTMILGVTVIDSVNGKEVRNSHDVNEKPL